MSTRLTALQTQLADLDTLIRDGTLQGDAARQARDALEAQVLALVQSSPASTGLPTRLVLGVSGFILTAGVAGYLWLGQPQAVAATPDAPALAAEAPSPDAPNAKHAARDTADFEAMAQRLSARLAQQPDDAEGWALLARTYRVMGKPELASHAEHRIKPARSDETAAGTALRVQVQLDPAIAAQPQPEDTVFIFARAASGGRAPLAIQRRQVKELPLSLVLDDSMAMRPDARLSSASQVVVGARISKAGDATPRSGDLEGLSPPLVLRQQQGRDSPQAVAIVIARALP